MAKSPETRPETQPDQKGEERSLYPLYTLNPNDLVASIVEITPSLPDGRIDFALNRATNTLQSFEIGTHTMGLPSRAIGVIKVTDSDTGNQVIDIAQSCLINHLTADSTHLSIELDNNTLKSARFNTRLHTNPHVSAIFLPGEDETITSQANIHMSLVSQLTGLSLEFSGDDRTLTFQSLNDYNQEQLALIFKDVHVPDIDIQTLIRQSIILGDSHAAKNLTLPTLTFNRDEYSYQPFHSRTYLMQKGESLPQIAEGTTISGIAIIENDENPTNKQPYQVNVEIHTVDEVPYEYSDGSDTAIKISGITTISDGINEPVIFDEPFIVLSDMDWLTKNPQRIPGTAFKYFHALK